MKQTSNNLTTELVLPKMLCLYEDEDCEQGIYVPISNIALVFNTNTNLIEAVADITGVANTCIKSNSNVIYKISKLGCKSYAEFMIALDLYDLIYDPSQDNNTEFHKFKSDQLNALSKLTLENIRLKNKLKTLKKLVNEKIK